MNEERYTAEELQQMRQILAREDSRSAQITHFDLNHPPTPPYHFQEYPKMVYKNGEFQIVQNAEQYQRAKADGWKDNGLIGKPDEVELDDETMAIVADKDRQIAEQKAKNKR